MNFLQWSSIVFTFGEKIKIKRRRNFKPNRRPPYSWWHPCNPGPRLRSSPAIFAAQFQAVLTRALSALPRPLLLVPHPEACLPHMYMLLQEPFPVILSASVPPHCSAAPAYPADLCHDLAYLHYRIARLAQRSNFTRAGTPSHRRGTYSHTWNSCWHLGFQKYPLQESYLQGVNRYLFLWKQYIKPYK